jgi:hypothetical protein
MWKINLTLGNNRKRDAEAHGRVKEFVFEALGRNPDIGISINEIICTDPSCPGTETVILVMAPMKKTAACKVSKELRDVTEDDVRDALRNLTTTP